MALQYVASLCNVAFFFFIYPEFIHCYDKVLFECDFDGKDCQWSQPYRFKWRHLNHNTTSDNTGPRFDHTTRQEGKGCFYYLETSAYQSTNGSVVNWKDGEQAMLTSPSIRVPSPSCPITISFYYNMYGRDVGWLQLQVNGNSSVLWERKGQQQVNGVTWEEAKVIIPSVQVYPRFKVNFIGARGSSAFGDIAIDDIKISQDTGCHDLLDCNFDNNKTCGLTQSTSDNFDWQLHNGHTSTKGTGPNQDHTQLRGNKGYYILLEASSRGWGHRSPGDTAILISPLYTMASSCGIKLTFFYSMYGAHIGNLSVKIHGSQGPVLWEKIGEQHTDGDTWSEATIDIPHTQDTSTFQFEIIGTRGNDYQGDIAIDDIVVRRNCHFQQDSNSTHRPFIETPTTTNKITNAVESTSIAMSTTTSLATTTRSKTNHAPNKSTIKNIITKLPTIKSSYHHFQRTKKATRPPSSANPNFWVMTTQNIHTLISSSAKRPESNQRQATPNYMGGNNTSSWTRDLPVSEANGDSTSKTNVALIVGVTVGGFLAFMILLVVSLVLFKTLRKQKTTVAPSASANTNIPTPEPAPNQQPLQIQLVNMCIESDINKFSTSSSK